MSREEENAIIANAVREKRELSSQSGLIRMELENLRDALYQLTAIVDRRTTCSDDGTVPEFPEAVRKYADLSKLRALLEEQARIAKRWRSIQQLLSVFGL